MYDKVLVERQDLIYNLAKLEENIKALKTEKEQSQAYLDKVQVKVSTQKDQLIKDLQEQRLNNIKLENEIKSLQSLSQTKESEIQRIKESLSIEKEK